MLDLRRGKKNTFDAHYVKSKFLGRSSASDILQAFLDGIKGLNLLAIVQVFMDGPATKLKFFESLKSYRLQRQLPKLINIGSCGIYFMEHLNLVLKVPVDNQKRY